MGETPWAFESHEPVFNLETVSSRTLMIGIPIESSSNDFARGCDSECVSAS